MKKEKTLQPKQEIKTSRITGRKSKKKLIWVPIEDTPKRKKQL